jgi:hypothetical protein
MGEIISRGLASSDDPMFSGGLEAFSVRKRNKTVVTATGLSLGGMLDTLASFTENGEERPAEPEEVGDGS